ncbi:NADH:flavin oxidoreductase/NADH oxidase [Cellulomonas edaphi]|uniref:NADH:flavin oxidoreductase/NADH oxidase n=1 Tax=Cellulomonas edaphi TaxID=3053468 RepID=A0ABT7SBG4_9CELL|nr:NADH:flavin oxidoreductase/NADH oxidase [Cellulomons edaphi]MDM7832294.1 NADH:flavin oxidoreductase/NADH oxidase [Cellulomons edaphi]
MTSLFDPLSLRGTTFVNRAWLAPMCQYSAVDGVPNDWHLVHLGARASGGFGLLLTEATAVAPEGRISPQDTGIWNDEQVVAWRRITDFVHARGTHVGIQLAHAGRKASTYAPFVPGDGTVPVAEGGWEALAPSPVAFPGLAAPAELSAAAVARIPRQFAAATRRALAAGFDVVEIHAAHGYLLHQFLSPLSNTRDDEYGGTAENRARLLVETADAVRAEWPDHLPLAVRVSATDWVPDGLGVEDVALVAKELAGHGVDLVDVSTGGNALADIPVGPAYQVPAAREVRAISGLPVAAVGVLEDPALADRVVAAGDADAVLIGRGALRDPSWALRAAHELGVATRVLPGSGPVVDRARVEATGWQPQYVRGAWR